MMDICQRCSRMGKCMYLRVILYDSALQETGWQYRCGAHVLAGGYRGPGKTVC